jgi:hypothetical protein
MVINDLSVKENGARQFGETLTVSVRTPLTA